MEALEIMKDFAEGRINTDDFFEIFKQNVTIRDILIKDKTRPYYDYNSYYAPERFLDIYNSKKMRDRDQLYSLIKRYFIRANIN